MAFCKTMQKRFMLANGTVKTVPYEDIDKHSTAFRFFVGTVLTVHEDINKHDTVHSAFFVGNGLDRSVVGGVIKEQRYRGRF